MKLIGLTGYIGSGKTTVATIFEFLGAKIYNSDDAAKKLMETPIIKTELKVTFGPNLLNSDNSINRTYLRELVFENAPELKKLNDIVHPAVYKDFNNFIIENQNSSVIVFESALLLKSKNITLFDFIIFVTASKNILYKRLKQRNGFKIELIDQILNSQRHNSSKKLQNKLIKLQNSEKDLLIPKVVKLYQSII